MSEADKQKAPAMAGWRTLTEWLEAGQGLPAFERYDQLSWFIRNHREELIESGAFMPGRGSRPSYVNGQFSTRVKRILKREARGAAMAPNAPAKQAPLNA